VTDDIEEAIAIDATVKGMIQRGSSLESIVVALVRQKKDLQERLEYFMGIAPFKIVGGDGRVLIWRCPDHLVPEQGNYPFQPVT
jgi:hypothetical protein